MNDEENTPEARNAVKFLIIYGLGWFSIPAAALFFFWKIPVISAQPTPNMMIEYFCGLIVCLFLSIKTIRYANVEINNFVEDDSDSSLNDTRKSIKLVQGTLWAVAFVTTKVIMIYAGADHSVPAAASTPWKNAAGQTTLASELNSSSRQGVCTYLLFRKDGHIGRSEAKVSLAECRDHFPVAFNKCGTNFVSGNPDSIIQAVQANFGDRASHDRTPGPDFLVVASIQCAK